MVDLLLPHIKTIEEDATMAKSNVIELRRRARMIVAGSRTFPDRSQTNYDPATTVDENGRFQSFTLPRLWYRPD